MICHYGVCRIVSPRMRIVCTEKPKRLRGIPSRVRVGEAAASGAGAGEGHEGDGAGGAAEGEGGGALQDLG